MTNDTRKGRQKKRRSKKVLKTMLITIVVALLTLGGGAIYFASKLHGTAADAFHELERDKKSNSTTDIKKGNLSVLLLGSDARPGEDMTRTRTDTIIVATFNKKDKSVILTSIPRDSYVELVGPELGYKDKINHASAKGNGINSTVDTVENLLGFKMDYYALVNFTGLRQIVDELGGIDVDVKFTFDFTEGGRTLHFEEGPATLDGEHALAYARDRKSPGSGGDLGRGQRQQQVITAIINKAASFSGVSRFDGVMDAIGDNLKTNFDLSSLGNLKALYDYAGSLNDIETLQLEGEDWWTHLDSGQRIYYYKVSEESLAGIKARLREHLELKPSEMDTSPTTDSDTGSAG